MQKIRASQVVVGNKLFGGLETVVGIRRTNGKKFGKLSFVYLDIVDENGKEKQGRIYTIHQILEIF